MHHCLYNTEGMKISCPPMSYGFVSTSSKSRSKDLKMDLSLLNHTHAETASRVGQRQRANLDSVIRCFQLQLDAPHQGGNGDHHLSLSQPCPQTGMCP